MVENECQRNAQVTDTARVFSSASCNSLRKVEFTHVSEDSQVTTHLPGGKPALRPVLAPREATALIVCTSRRLVAVYCLCFQLFESGHFA